MLKCFYVMFFYLIVNSIPVTAMEYDNHDEHVLYTPRKTPYTPRTNEVIKAAKDYEFIPQEKSTFNINVVFCAAKGFSNPDAIFAKGVLYEFGLKDENNEENSLSCYMSAAKAGCSFAYERLYWVYTNSELGLEKDDKAAEFYRQLYLKSTGRDAISEERSYLPNPELLKEVKKALPSGNKQPAGKKSYKKSNSCRHLTKTKDYITKGKVEKCSVQ